MDSGGWPWSVLRVSRGCPERKRGQELIHRMTTHQHILSYHRQPFLASNAPPLARASAPPFPRLGVLGGLGGKQSPTELRVASFKFQVRHLTRNWKLETGNSQVSSLPPFIIHNSSFIIPPPLSPPLTHPAARPQKKPKNVKMEYLVRGDRQPNTVRNTLTQS